MGNPDQLKFEATPEPDHRHLGFTVVHAALPDAYDQGYINATELRARHGEQSPEDHKPAESDGGIPTVVGPEGSYVSIAKRAAHLHKSLDSIGRSNQRIGFRDAADLPPHNSEIWRRYTRKTERVIQGANRNQKEFASVAKQEFWRSTGIAALHGAGLVDEYQRSALGRSMWRSFSEKYGTSGAETTRLRNRAKRLYARQQKTFSEE